MTTKAELKKNFADLIGADDDATLEEFYASYKDMAKVAPCLSLIVLERDEEAKARWPDYYESLKGAPLNPIQIAAIETLLTGTKAMKKPGRSEWVRDDLRRGRPYEEIATAYSEPTQAVLKKICKIRGW